MPSSISNSDRNHWLLTWMVVAILLLCFFAGYEYYLKKHGFEPAVEFNKDLWSWHRRAASDHPEVIALIGTSRMQLGINTATMRAQFPNNKIVQLAINGQYPMASMKSLADDESFTGTVIMSFMAQMLEPRYEDMQAEYNDYAQYESSWYLALDSWLTAKFKYQFRFLHPLLGLKDLVNHWSKYHSMPKPFYASAHYDGSAFGDYTKVNTIPLKKHFISEKRKNYQEYPIMNTLIWQEQVKKLADYIKKIKHKGGQVILVRFPTSDDHWVLDEQFYPRHQFWDTLVNAIPAAHFIHFKDDEILRSFELPDSSHLDQKDAIPFTVRIIEILKDKQYIPDAKN